MRLQAELYVFNIDLMYSLLTVKELCKMHPFKIKQKKTTTDVQLERSWKKVFHYCKVFKILHNLSFADTGLTDVFHITHVGHKLCRQVRLKQICEGLQRKKITVHLAGVSNDLLMSMELPAE